jgi:hypothetical protein
MYLQYNNNKFKKQMTYSNEIFGKVLIEDVGMDKITK